MPLQPIAAENARILHALRSVTAGRPTADTTRTAIAGGAIVAHRACDRKTKFRTLAYLEKLRPRLERIHGRKYSAYHCPFCLCYHLSTNHETHS